MPQAQGKTEIADMAASLEKFKAAAEEQAALMVQKEEAQAADQLRADGVADFLGSVETAVGAAKDGDFSQRVAAVHQADEFAPLANSINQLLESVADGVGATSAVMARVAEGDLTQRMSGQFSGEFATLQSDVNGTIERLSELMTEIAQTVFDVRGGATQISGESASLAERAEQQASSLEQTAATMEEMSASIKSNADNPTEVQNLATEASGRAVQGAEIVSEAVGAMNAIEAGSAKISDIISVIDGIAFQTNLLALNAAVEAARAGDGGKGFAVVASEVRALAQRSSEAARDIRELIEKSAGQVSTGVGLVTRTGEALSGIADSIRSVESAIQNIAASSAEQSSGVSEISSTVAHLDEITQQNSTLSEHSAAKARELSTRAERLGDLVAFFTVADADERLRKTA